MKSFAYEMGISCTQNQFTEADLYKQLAYFCYILDPVRCIDKVLFLSTWVSLLM